MDFISAFGIAIRVARLAAHRPKNVWPIAERFVNLRLAGTMQFGTITANAKKIKTTFRRTLAMINRLGLSFGMWLVRSFVELLRSFRFKVIVPTATGSAGI
jgi:hypothetical protein